MLLLHCAAVSSRALPKPGDIVADRYAIEAQLGEGGMAVVFRARHTGTDRACAVKFIQPHLVKHDKTVSLFLKEAKVAGRIRPHPHIVDVLDSGYDEDRGVPYIAMELLDGEPLDEILEQRGPIDITTARVLLEQLGEALGEAHRSGVIHRDLKPANLFVTRDHKGREQLKVMDFGIAKKQSDAAQKKGRHLTGEGYTAGTPAYMAPEQITDFGSVTHSCDIYSLGIIAFELLTGSLPFDHEESMPLLMMHLNDQPPTPSTLRDLPTGLDDLVLAMLEKSPRDRPRSCAAVAAELEGM